jgi:hypothetical protein
MMHVVRNATQEVTIMARKAKDGAVNKSEAIRKVLSQNPQFKASEVIATLDAKGIKVKPNLVYFVMGKIKGTKGRRRKIQRKVESVMGSANGTGHGSGDVLATIKKVKGVAAELGGLKKLAALIAALSE